MIATTKCRWLSMWLDGLVACCHIVAWRVLGMKDFAYRGIYLRVGRMV